MTPCTTFAGGINPFLSNKPRQLVTEMQRIVMSGLKDHGPIRASELADKLLLPAISVREVLQRLANKEAICKRSGTRWPVYFLKETLQ